MAFKRSGVRVPYPPLFFAHHDRYNTHTLHHRGVRPFAYNRHAPYDLDPIVYNPDKLRIFFLFFLKLSI